MLEVVSFLVALGAALGGYEIEGLAAFAALAFLVVFLLYLFGAAFWAAYFNWFNWHVLPTVLVNK
jgi:hypothetical protein